MPIPTPESSSDEANNPNLLCGLKLARVQGHSLQKLSDITLLKNQELVGMKLKKVYENLPNGAKIIVSKFPWFTWYHSRDNQPVSL